MENNNNNKKTHTLGFLVWVPLLSVIKGHWFKSSEITQQQCNYTLLLQQLFWLAVNKVFFSELDKIFNIFTVLWLLENCEQF